jgi:hypothetical protein
VSKFKLPRQVNTHADLIRFQKEINVYSWREGLRKPHDNKVKINSEFSRSEHQLWVKLQRKGFKVNENGNLYNPGRETAAARSRSSDQSRSDNPAPTKRVDEPQKEATPTPSSSPNNIVNSTKTNPQPGWSETFLKKLWPF